MDWAINPQNGSIYECETDDPNKLITAGGGGGGAAITGSGGVTATAIFDGNTSITTGSFNDNGVGTLTARDGNGATLRGSSGVGATANLVASSSNNDGVDGGVANVTAGNANVGDADGGSVVLTVGAGHGTGRAGQILIVNGTSLPGAATGTLTNAPKSGNAQTWLEVVINGVTHYLPAWHI